VKRNDCIASGAELLASDEMIEAVIFDCDGTLVDSEVLGHEILVEVLAEFGVVVPLTDALVARFRGRKLHDCLAEIQAELEHKLPEEDFIRRFRQRMAEVFPVRLRAIDGALDLVRSLRHPFCVASSGPREKIEMSLSLTGLLPFFKNQIFSSYEVGVWKPNPGLFLHAAKTLGVEPHRCAVVEDSIPGIQAGLAAGMTVFAFQPNGSELIVPKDVPLVRHLSELRPLLV
jgi:HAD superfamily hydrolase (TIGR01509 family)